MHRVRIVFLVLLPALLAYPQLSIAQTCPAGQEPITHENRALARSAGIPDSAICWKPNIAAAGINEAQAKQYLNSLPKRPLSQCAPPTQQNIERLNGTFAVCAAQFFKAYTERYGQVLITSAFRDATPGSGPDGRQSANQCAGGAPGSNHSRGVAMDVNPADEGMYPTLWKFASDNPQFGVCFPFQDGRTGSIRDRPHMILAGIGGSEGALCARQGVTQPCNGAPPLRITDTPIQSQSPTSQFANSIRQWFSPQQQTTQPSVVQPAVGSQPISTTQNPLGAFNQEPIPTTPQAMPTSTSTSMNAAADRLEELAFGGQSTTSTATATSVPLVVSGSDAVALTGTQQASTTPVTTQGAISPSQTTFTSGDLAWQDQTISSSPVSGIQAIIITIRATLNRILQHLVPFGGFEHQHEEGGDGTARTEDLLVV